MSASYNEQVHIILIIVCITFSASTIILTAILLFQRQLSLKLAAHRARKGQFTDATTQQILNEIMERQLITRPERAFTRQDQYADFHTVKLNPDFRDCTREAVEFTRQKARRSVAVTRRAAARSVEVGANALHAAVAHLRVEDGEAVYEPAPGPGQGGPWYAEYHEWIGLLEERERAAEKEGYVVLRGDMCDFMVENESGGVKREEEKDADLLGEA